MGRRKGYKHSKETIEKISNNRKGITAWNKGKKLGPNPEHSKRMTGKNHPRYKGGTIGYGYRLVRIDGKYYLKHRLIWEAIYGPIPKDMIVHHKDGDRLNNNIDNLEIMSRSQHTSLHNKMRGIAT